MLTMSVNEKVKKLYYVNPCPRRLSAIPRVEFKKLARSTSEQLMLQE